MLLRNNGCRLAPWVAFTVEAIWRIASCEMLPDGDLLPQLMCSLPVFSGGGGYEAGQHGDA
jgi:hypothetical protein